MSRMRSAVKFLLPLGAAGAAVALGRSVLRERRNPEPFPAARARMLESPLVRRQTAKIVESLDLAPGMWVLDVGAGVGRLSVPVATRVGPGGEIVALDEQGRPRFQLLQQGNRQLVFLFDILWLDGHDIRKLPYTDRRELLERTLRRSPALVKLSQQLAMSGDRALLQAAQEGWEGIIAKRKTSIYEGRRSKEWLKIKAINEQELIVIGWNPSTHSSKEIGSLHLAVMGDDGELHYAGKVGTGFSYNQRVWWKETLAKDVVPAAPAKDAPRERAATWVKPRHVVQVAFTEWTGDNRLRHPSFQGLREDKDARDVRAERPA